VASDPVPPGPSRPRQTLPRPAMALAACLLLVPLVGLAIVPVYARADPHLWGFPFFYWYQFVWVFLASGFTFGAYVVIERARRGGDQ
jgi:uncharacterized RDD family membrane protein YckC